MSIARGRDWGEVGPIPEGAVMAATDAEAAAVVGAARRAGAPAPPVVLTGGDLARTLGVIGPPLGPGSTAGPGGADRRTESADPDAADRRTERPGPGAADRRTESADLGSAVGTRVRVDAGAALVDGRLCWFVAHLVARRSWWRGRVLVVANAAFMGSANVAPRAHPGDGRLDVLDTELRLGARIRAKSRLAAGAHVPHPDIAQRRVAAAQFDLDPALDVYGDGLRLGRAAAVSVRVEPAALEVWLPVPGAGPR